MSFQSVGKGVRLSGYAKVGQMGIIARFTLRKPDSCPVFRIVRMYHNPEISSSLPGSRAQLHKADQ
jgi:hypothetical protein